MYVHGCGLVRAKKLLRVVSLLKTWPTFPRALHCVFYVQYKKNITFVWPANTFGLNFPEFIKRFSAFFTFLKLLKLRKIIKSKKSLFL